MDEPSLRDFRWYLQGCRKFDWRPLSEIDFRTQYKRYRRCGRALEHYEQRRTRHLNRRGSNYRDDVFLERLIRSIWDEHEQLNYLATAVSAGHAMDDEDGGAGMPAHRCPDVPVLVGAGAKPLPHLDPEPWVRDL
ncbi:MAG: hypothetical protein JWL77_151 [Chthonomonadaceae bacterium]|nr:hypothetical protein [Chthonomonadaceae bacterium]